MIDKQMFHIYDKATNRPVKVCMTTEELEQMLAKKEVDIVHWEIQPCYNISSSEEQSYWLSTNTHLLGVDGFPNTCYDK